MLNERRLEALNVPVDRRVAELATLYGSGEAEVLIPLTQEEPAGLAGTTRPTVNQVLRGCEYAGIVRLRRGKTVVTDPDALAARVR